MQERFGYTDHHFYVLRNVFENGVKLRSLNYLIEKFIRKLAPCFFYWLQNYSFSDSCLAEETIIALLTCHKVCIQSLYVFQWRFKSRILELVEHTTWISEWVALLNVLNRNVSETHFAHSFKSYIYFASIMYLELVRKRSEPCKIAIFYSWTMLWMKWIDILSRTIDDNFSHLHRALPMNWTQTLYNVILYICRIQI